MQYNWSRLQITLPQNGTISIQKLADLRNFRLSHVTRTYNRMPKIILNYRQNGRRRLGRPLKILDEAGTGLSRANWWRIMMMMMKKGEKQITFTKSGPNSSWDHVTHKSNYFPFVRSLVRLSIGKAASLTVEFYRLRPYNQRPKHTAKYATTASFPVILNPSLAIVPLHAI